MTILHQRIETTFFWASALVFFITATAADARKSSQNTPLCVPPNAPHKLEKTIGQCQQEIKFALLQEALKVFRESVDVNGSKSVAAHIRNKRDVFTNEEQRIAGCLLQCVYRKMKAVDETGFPVATGLVKIYSEGVKDRNYYLATIQAVQQCLSQEIQRRNKDPKIAEGEGYTCDVAYNMFNCISDQIELLCGSSP